MILRSILLGVFLLNIQCHDSDSSEGNRIEVNPFYDAIIFSDIADIINEFENNNYPFDDVTNSNSESDENIEELLSEYQHYLDRAHKQRKSYYEKTMSKNKVPLFRHDRFSKVKPFDTRGKYANSYYTNSYFVPAQYKLHQQPYSNPLDLLIPLSPKERYMAKFYTTSPLPRNNNGDIKSFDKFFNNNKNIDLPPAVHKATYELIKSSCYCKKNQIPCDCSCKQCLVPLETYPNDTHEGKRDLVPNTILSDNSFNNLDHLAENKMRGIFENNLNIRIKVDIQIPKQDSISNVITNQKLDSDEASSRELSSIVNIPYLNFPTPMDMFRYKKSSKFIKHDSTPLHKITIRKKKKSKVSNSNKKHRKKVITFHNIKVEPRHFLPSIIENYNATGKSSIKKDTAYPNVTELSVPVINKTVEFVNKTQKDESIYLIVNITNNTNNGTEDDRKNDNSIETDYTKVPKNFNTTDKSTIIRVRRNSGSPNNSSNIPKDNSTVKINIPLKNTNQATNVNDKKVSKKTDKILLTDAELLYWPNSRHNKTDNYFKNITYRILENENKKTKLNMSSEAILQNHTRALEQAIFGKADWDDIDTVAPEFMAFVGKYIRGVLTFCSQSVCHSMKCAEKSCIHRICTPEERLNNKGHCSGSNFTDSIASMESIMDLPSNVAFEVVDILHEKMLGKIYGKMTLCITSKCITFAASKKNFVQTKCNAKELNSVGQCSTTDNMKIL